MLRCRTTSRAVHVGNSGDTVEGFEALQRMYREALEEKAQALEVEARAIAAGAPPEPHAQALRRQLHQLSGSAGAYGYDAMGEMARGLEKRWVQWLNCAPAERSDGRDLQRDSNPLMSLLLAALRAAALPAEGAD
jgi:HPt (histidine-containing phosphotransfer) domain-containing protein